MPCWSLCYQLYDAETCKVEQEPFLVALDAPHERPASGGDRPATGAYTKQPQQQPTGQRPKDTSTVDVEALIKLVDALQLDSYAERRQKVEDALRGKELTKEKETVKNVIERVEEAGRVHPQKKDITFATGVIEPVEVLEAYTWIWNLVRIEQHPVYRKALGEWQSEVALFESRVEPK